MAADVCIYYTGTLITPDGSDSFAGQPCEPGTGATEMSGWVDPDWSLGEVRANREDVRPDTWTPDDGPMIDWAVTAVANRLGWIDSPESSDGRTYYAAEATGPYDALYTGVSLTLAAHVDAPPAIRNAIRYALIHAQRPARYAVVV